MTFQRPIVIDIETVAILGKTRNNRISALKVGITNIGAYTLSPVKSEYQSTYGGSWEVDGLDGILVRKRDKGLAGVAADMVDKCKKNGIDPYDPIVIPKLNLVALAILLGAAVLSADNRGTERSMDHICTCFGVPFYSLDSIDP